MGEDGTGSPQQPGTAARTACRIALVYFLSTPVNSVASRRCDPYGPGVHLGFYFPGGYGPGQDPFDNYLAWISIRSLEQAGAYVIPVRYDDSLFEPDPDRFFDGVRREVQGGMAFHCPDRVTVLGKSRGTQALRLVCSEDLGLPPDTRLIWQTPVWRSDKAWEAAKKNPFESLHLVGLADHEYHDPDRHQAVPGDTVAIAAADHGLSIPGDVLATIDALRTVSEAIIRFAGRQ